MIWQYKSHIFKYVNIYFFIYFIILYYFLYYCYNYFSFVKRCYASLPLRNYKRSLEMPLWYRVYFYFTFIFVFMPKKK